MQFVFSNQTLGFYITKQISTQASNKPYKSKEVSRMPVLICHDILAAKFW
jgi:hypothetical protein